MKTLSIKISFVCLFITSVSFTTFSQVNTFPSNGNVGIGTSTPIGKVEIKGPYNGNSQLILNTTASNAELRFSDNDVVKGFVWYDKYSDGMAFGRGSTSTSIWVNTSGNTGIGTSTPTGKLEIKGPYNGNSQLIINTTSSNAELRFSDNDIIKGFVWYDKYLDGMAFGRGNTSNSIWVTASGNTGIGTSYPAYKLDVIGTIRSREVKVDMNGADFVFENDYKLMPLNELEKYLQKEKHLPEIAPAKEMESNGVELGNLNSKLLQKVEELTLYLIEQNKKVERLEKEISTLKKQH